MIDALGYAAMMDAKVISISYNHNHSEAYEEAYYELGNSYDVFVSVAAGNTGLDLDALSPSTPGSYPARYNFDHLVTVMGTFPDDEPGSCDSNGTSYGEETVDVAAPGFLLTHFPDAFVDFPAPDCGSGGCTICGTSFSAPIVAGIAALYRAEYPTHTAAQVRTKLINTSRAVQALDGLCVAEGVVNAAGMLDKECDH